jgi:hypothetical protein
MTAHIIHRKRIFCEKCNHHYKLFIKQEKLCSGQLLQLICNYLFSFVVIIGGIIGIIVFDGYLKTDRAAAKPAAAKD